MPRVTLDTTDAVSFEAVEPGPYPMSIHKAEVTKTGSDSKTPGAPMLVVYFEFDDPTVAKKAGHVIRNYMLGGKGAGFTREFIKATTGEDIPVGGTFDFDTDDITGRRVIVNITNKEYQGNLQNEADKVVAA